jgi:tetratricopeptide (TPR) repeat protein
LADQEEWNSEEWNNQTNKAIADLTKVIELNPGYQAAFYLRGFIYHSSTKYDAAILDFDKAIALDPRDDWSYYWRGNARYYNGEIPQAITDLEKFVELAGDNYWVGEKPIDLVINGVKDNIEMLKKEPTTP